MLVMDHADICGKNTLEQRILRWTPTWKVTIAFTMGHFQKQMKFAQYFGKACAKDGNEGPSFGDDPLLCGAPQKFEGRVRPK